MKRWKKLSADSVEFLRNEVIFNIVTIPEALAYEQLDGIFDELNSFGFRIKQLIINNIIKVTDSDFLVAKADQQRKYIEMLYDKFPYLKIVELPMNPTEIIGLAKLKLIGTHLFT